MKWKVWVVAGACLVVVGVSGGVPAWADHGGGNGDCTEVEDGGRCEDNDFSPSFQDSPVDRSFNPVICVLPDSCRWEGEKPKE